MPIGFCIIDDPSAYLSATSTRFSLDTTPARKETRKNHIPMENNMKEIKPESAAGLPWDLKQPSYGDPSALQEELEPTRRSELSC